MAIVLSTESLVALIICAFVGSLAYVVLNALSSYKKQKADAAKIQDKVAASGRDPTQLDQLTTEERWELTKAQRFDKIFIVADVLAVIIGTGLGIAILYLFGGAFMADECAKYGVLGFFAGLIATLVVYETLIKAAAKGEWSDKSAEFFQGIKAVAEDAIESNGGLEALIKKYVAAGFSKREAKKLAKQKLVETIDEKP